MLQPISVGNKSLADYTHLVGRPLVKEIRDLAEDLQGLRVLHVSATAFGGGVSEILYTLIPLMNDAGIEAEWQVMLGREEFYNATKRLHNALQGNPESLTEEEWEVYFRYNERNATEITGDWDVIIIHDPQPAGIKRLVPDKAATWVWRCHIDLSEPNPDAIDRIVPLVREYDATVWHVPEYVPAGMDGGSGRRVHPARPPSIRSRPRTWPSRPRTQPSCATSSASMSTGPSCARCRASIPGRTRSA